MTLSRRSVIKNVAKLSALGSLGLLTPGIVGCNGRKDRRLTLNVVLHGLFVVNFTDAFIELLTPQVNEHEYHAGNWDIREVCELKKGKEYTLWGVNRERDIPQIADDCNIVFSQSVCRFNVHADQSYFKVWLPFPAAIHLLRCSPQLHDPQPPSCLTNPTDPNKIIYVKRLSLCQVLVYRVNDYDELKLLGTRWKPWIDKTTFTANLHFWAEPPGRLSPNHAEHAYEQLDTLLDPLKLRLGIYSTVPLDRDTGVTGLPPEQEQGWSDWASGGGEGAYPTNCCAVMTRK